MKHRVLIIFSLLIPIMLSIVTGESKQQPKAFESYVKEFEDITNKKRGRLVVRFGTFSNERTLGVCRYIQATVLIKKEYWNSISKIRRRSIMYHELGHCICWEGHDNRRLLDNCPKSLMYGEAISRECLNKHWQYYIDDLYNKCN